MKNIKDIAGPPVWLLLHLTPFIIKKEHLKFYVEMVHSLTKIFSCATCRDHLKTNLTRNPAPSPEKSNGMNMFEWSIRLHNAVNESLGRDKWTVVNAHRFYGERIRVYNYHEVCKMATQILISTYKPFMASGMVQWLRSLFRIMGVYDKADWAALPGLLGSSEEIFYWFYKETRKWDIFIGPYHKERDEILKWAADCHDCRRLQTL